MEAVSAFTSALKTTGVTYICLRLMEGADIYQVAKNCRTSVEMIETFYASHIKNTLDAAAINVRKGTIAGNGKNTKTRSFRGCGRILLPLRCRSLRRRKPRSLCQRIPDGLNGLRQMAANKQIIDTDDRNRLPPAEPAETFLHRHVRCDGRVQRYPRLPPGRSPDHNNRYAKGGS